MHTQLFGTQSFAITCMHFESLCFLFSHFQAAMFSSEISYLESKPYFETTICQVSFIPDLFLPLSVPFSLTSPTHPHPV